MDGRAAIEAVWRIESARIIAALTRMVRDVGLAEDLAQEAFLAALERWPESGVPENPGAWLMTTARRKAIDHFRRLQRLEEKHQELGRELAAQQEAGTDEIDERIADPVGDDLLRLIFMCCHPVLSHEARVALTLRLVGGLTTEEIARSFLVATPTVAQRIVRARSPEETDWPRIAALYDALIQVAPSPVVALNRAVAVAMAYGAAAGLELVDRLLEEPALQGYHLLPGVRGDLLARLGRHREARAEFERAASLARNGRERALLLKRAAEAGKRPIP